MVIEGDSAQVWVVVKVGPVDVVLERERVMKVTGQQEGFVEVGGRSKLESIISETTSIQL